jgi:hypothetical protein
MAMKLDDLTNISSHRGIYAEIIKTLSLVDPDYNTSFLKKVYSDIVCLFNGEYPGYRASNTKYHNLEHTCSVILATARLIHGLHVQGQIFSSRVIELGLIAAKPKKNGKVPERNIPSAMKSAPSGSWGNTLPRVASQKMILVTVAILSCAQPLHCP